MEEKNPRFLELKSPNVKFKKIQENFTTKIFTNCY